jgi:hypothetical protein
MMADGALVLSSGMRLEYLLEPTMAATNVSTLFLI